MGKPIMSSSHRPHHQRNMADLDNQAPKNHETDGDQEDENEIDESLLGENADYLPAPDFYTEFEETQNNDDDRKTDDLDSFSEASLQILRTVQNPSTTRTPRSGKIADLKRQRDENVKGADKAIEKFLHSDQAEGTQHDASYSERRSGDNDEDENDGVQSTIREASQEDEDNDDDEDDDEDEANDENDNDNDSRRESDKRHRKRHHRHPRSGSKQERDDHMTTDTSHAGLRFDDQSTTYIPDGYYSQFKQEPQERMDLGDTEDKGKRSHKKKRKYKKKGKRRKHRRRRHSSDDEDDDDDSEETDSSESSTHPSRRHEENDSRDVFHPLPPQVGHYPYHQQQQQTQQQNRHTRVSSDIHDIRPSGDVIPEVATQYDTGTGKKAYENDYMFTSSQYHENTSTIQAEKLQIIQTIKNDPELVEALGEENVQHMDTNWPYQILKEIFAKAREYIQQNKDLPRYREGGKWVLGSGVENLAVQGLGVKRFLGWKNNLSEQIDNGTYDRELKHFGHKVQSFSNNHPHWYTMLMLVGTMAAHVAQNNNPKDPNEQTEEDQKETNKVPEANIPSQPSNPSNVPSPLGGKNPNSFSQAEADTLGMSDSNTPVPPPPTGGPNGPGRPRPPPVSSPGTYDGRDRQQGGEQQQQQQYNPIPPLQQQVSGSPPQSHPQSQVHSQFQPQQPQPPIETRTDSYTSGTMSQSREQFSNERESPVQEQRAPNALTREELKEILNSTLTNVENRIETRLDDKFEQKTQQLDQFNQSLYNTVKKVENNNEDWRRHMSENIAQLHSLFHSTEAQSSHAEDIESIEEEHHRSRRRGDGTSSQSKRPKSRRPQPSKNDSLSDQSSRSSSSSTPPPYSNRHTTADTDYYSSIGSSLDHKYENGMAFPDNGYSEGQMFSLTEPPVEEHRQYDRKGDNENNRFTNVESTYEDISGLGRPPTTASNDLYENQYQQQQYHQPNQQPPQPQNERRYDTTEGMYSQSQTHTQSEVNNNNNNNMFNIQMDNSVPHQERESIERLSRDDAVPPPPPIETNTTTEPEDGFNQPTTTDTETTLNRGLQETVPTGNSSTVSEPVFGQSTTQSGHPPSLSWDMQHALGGSTHGSRSSGSHSKSKSKNKSKRSKRNGANTRFSESIEYV